MRKTYAVKPSTEIELQFEDGKSLLIKFNSRALYHFNDFEDGIQILSKNTSQPEICAILIYIGSCELEKDMTIEKAREITCQLDPATINGIIMDFNESMGVTTNETMKELQKKTMQMFLETIAK